MVCWIGNRLIGPDQPLQRSIVQAEGEPADDRKALRYLRKFALKTFEAAKTPQD